MNITLNGAHATVPDETRVAALAGEGCAVAVNGEVVPRSDAAGRRLAEGDRVEVVTAVAGG